MIFRQNFLNYEKAGVIMDNNDKIDPKFYKFLHKKHLKQG